MAVIKVVDDQVVVKLSRLEALGAGRPFHPTITVPLDKVHAVYVSDPRAAFRSVGWQVFWLHKGSYIPHMLLLGTIPRQDSKRVFTAVYDIRPAVTIEMEPDSPVHWQALVVSVKDAERVAQQLRVAVNDAKAAAGAGGAAPGGAPGAGTGPAAGNSEPTGATGQQERVPTAEPGAAEPGTAEATAGMAPAAEAPAGEDPASKVPAGQQ